MEFCAKQENIIKVEQDFEEIPISDDAFSISPPENVEILRRKSSKKVILEKNI